MRDLVLKQVAAADGPQENRNKIRRFLQIILLKVLHESKSGSALAFTGGTAFKRRSEVSIGRRVIKL